MTMDAPTSLAAAAAVSPRQAWRLRLLGGLMVAASLLAWWMTPTKFWSSHTATVKYETLFPQSFGNWVLAPAQANAIVNPQQQETLDAIYDEIVTKTYVEQGSGRRIMVSLAYGNNQSRATQVHKPEVCYPAQGFTLLEMNKGTLQTNDAYVVPVMRIVAQMGRRHEPLTYWIRSGDRVVRGSIEQNLARISLGLRGYIPDGLLFRVSEINTDSKASFELQDRFMRDFLAVQAPQARESLIGTPGAP